MFLSIPLVILTKLMNSAQLHLLRRLFGKIIPNHHAGKIVLSQFPKSFWSGMSMATFHEAFLVSTLTKMDQKNIISNEGIETNPNRKCVLTADDFL